MPRFRRALILGGLWLLAGLLAARQTAAVLRLPPGQRLTDLETWTGDHGVLRMPGPLYEKGTFAGTPFAGLILRPVTRAAEQGLGVFWTFGTLLLVVALGFVAARALPLPVARRTALFAAPAAISLMVVSLPVRNTFTLGQTSILPVLLVMLGFLPRLPDRRAGILIGLAAALQPTVLLFAPLLWLTGRRRAASVVAGTFAGISALTWTVMPRDSATYWFHHIAGAGLGEPADSLHNQSLHGVLLRLGLSGPAELALYGALAVVVAVLGLRRAARCARDGQLLLAIALTGCVTVAVAPTAWLHQQLWILLAVVGRVGRRKADRLVWPVAVVMVMTLSSAAIVPTSKGIRLIGENAPLLLAVAAACVVPFLSRRDPHWAVPIPTIYGEPAPGRFGALPLLRRVRRPLDRPNIFLELLLIRLFYWVYSHVRGSAAGGRAVAERHGRQIMGWERALGIDMERGFNHAVAGVPWLRTVMNLAYTNLHFLVPLTLLGLMYVRRPAMYRWTRTALGITTLLALLGFWLYPLAPPRLMPGLGYIDTLNGPQDFDSPRFGVLTAISNQYAAMPSLHIGWSLWCAVVIALLVRRWWLRPVGFLHPVVTTLVIVGTANHYLLDAVGGALVVALGFALQYVLMGRTREPRDGTASPQGDTGPEGKPRVVGPEGEAQVAGPEGKPHGAGPEGKAHVAGKARPKGDGETHPAGEAHPHEIPPETVPEHAAGG
ncbi:phosphatase PAP2 family protein [Streptomyces sp. NPDC002055]|uniref:bifunctional glycosyltransferase 87/phosphatase PAP2 family protein n=1 Tax=Streptomyces sp. NPDC002055 TaxID=3154534 RepID=UPI003321D3F0